MPGVLSTLRAGANDHLFSSLTDKVPTTMREGLMEALVDNRSSWILSATLAALGGGYYAYSRFGKETARDHVKAFKQQKDKKDREKRRRMKTAVNRKFIKNLKMLLKIAIPSIWSKEVMYLAILAFFLVTRTMLSIRIAYINGRIVKSIVDRQFYRFIARILTLGSIAVPASFVNSWLAFFTSRLALQFRTRLVHHFHDLYLQPMMYYRVTNIDSRITNPDQDMTETLSLWGRSLSELYSNLTKPTLDIALFSYQLAQLMGWEGPGMVMAYYAIALVIIRSISPPFGALGAMTQALEGKLRTEHHRLIIHSEEVAFYGGHNREKYLLNQRYAQVENHLKYTTGLKFGMGAFNGFLQKYGSVMCGYTVLGLPVFGSKSSEYLNTVTDTSDITQDYVRNSSLLINLSKAIGRIVTSYEAIQKLAGYTRLVSNLQKVLDDLGEGSYVRAFVNEDELKRRGLEPGKGRREDSDTIKFKDVSIVTPNGDILVDRINFSVKRGENLFIRGPNGCGKSSLFRMMGRLWPVWDGILSSPKQSEMFYIPQKPYLCHGTFRDQLIYPHTVREMLENNWTDEMLEDILTTVKLSYLLDKHGGWDSEKSWMDVLSGGEKQRIGMSRVFYHRPKYAILDECTSATSLDVEDTLYTHCKKLGITLITISHRASLWRYHDKVIEMDGRGGATFDDMVLPDGYQSGFA